MSLARRSFSALDQTAFAAASGDCNPMHLDPLQARRTQAGAPVVHGIHLLLWGLNAWAEMQPNLPPLRSLRATFSKFVYLEELVELSLTQRGPATARLDFSVGGSPRAKVALTFGDITEDCPSWMASPLSLVPPLTAPLDLSSEEISGRSGRIPFQLSAENAKAHFPAATQWLGPRRILALAASTYLVGMVCPGLHSIYSELSVQFCPESIDDGSLAFRVTDSDPRFRSVDMEIAGGGLFGTVLSSVRTPPVSQDSVDVLKALVRPAEFAGSTALIIGGSRGLGELTAKLIAAGGGRVILTWKNGKDDAERVIRDIRTVSNECQAIHYDALQNPDEQLKTLAEAPTHAYYFATPGIFRPQGEVFTTKRFSEFFDVYVNGFWQLAQALRLRRPDVSLFYPSSVAVAERPLAMTEYAMAKSAGEILSADINASLAPLHVTVNRLPRLLTDQTATVLPVETTPPVEIMLPIIREVQAWPR